MRKTIPLLTLLAIIITISLSGCSGYGDNDEVVNINDEELALADESVEPDEIVVESGGEILTIHFIDVGQADAIWIDYGEYEILIDGGNRKDTKLVADYISQYVDGPIELVIGTHLDADHIGGLIGLIPLFDIDKIIYNGSGKSNVTCNDFRSAASSKQNCEFSAAVDLTVKIDDNVSFVIIPPVKNYKDENENSIIAELIYNDVKVLFTGDMEKDSERDLMNRFTKADVLKLSHHGSKYTSSTTFLNIVKPEIVIITAGLVNQYNHPHYDALERVFNVGATAYGTFKDGTIVMSTDGKSYNFDAKTPLTLRDAGDRVSNAAIVNYIGNISTKKIHYLDCSSVTLIAEKNRIYFTSMSEASGYAPCGICKPQ